MPCSSQQYNFSHRVSKFCIQPIWFLHNTAILDIRLCSSAAPWWVIVPSSHCLCLAIIMRKYDIIHKSGSNKRNSLCSEMDWATARGNIQNVWLKLGFWDMLAMIPVLFWGKPFLCINISSNQIKDMFKWSLIALMPLLTTTRAIWLYSWKNNYKFPSFLNKQGIT